MDIEDHSERELLAGDRGYELELVKACLRGYFDPSAKPIGEVRPDASDRSFFAILRLNKVARIADVSMARSGSNAPGDYLPAAFDAYRRRTLSLNLASLSATFTAAGALRARGLPFVMMKGPVQQKLIYADPFIKPAGDVDIVVGAKDFETAKAALGTVGYSVSSQSASSWWSKFLGEQHMTSPSKPEASTLDLHYRLQQPGSPSPHGTDQFLARRQSVAISGHEVDFMSDMDLVLVASMSVAKALFNREPSGGYVCDVRAATLRLGSDEAGEPLLEHARRAGLLHTVLFGLRAADVLLGPWQGSLPAHSQQALARVGDKDLASMILAPWLPGLKWPKRRHILWDLCGGDSWRYASEGAWLVAADLGRRMVEKPR